MNNPFKRRKIVVHKLPEQYDEFIDASKDPNYKLVRATMSYDTEMLAEHGLLRDEPFSMKRFREVAEQKMIDSNAKTLRLSAKLDDPRESDIGVRVVHRKNGKFVYRWSGLKRWIFHTRNIGDGRDISYFQSLFLVITYLKNKDQRIMFQELAAKKIWEGMPDFSKVVNIG